MKIAYYLDSMRQYFHKRRMNIIADSIIELSESKSLLEKMVEEQMTAVIKEAHQSDYEQFIEKNKEHLAQVKNRVSARYIKLYLPMAEKVRNF